MKTRREIEQAAREAGPWTDDALRRVAHLRIVSRSRELTDDERDELRVLRQREITEAIRIRRGGAR